MGKIIKFIVPVLFFLFFARENSAEALQITSKAFKDGERIPLKYTGLSYNMSPPLSWKDVPEGTKSFVLTVEDPDASGGTWVHWVAYDIPAGERFLRPNLPLRGILPNGMKQGLNSFHTPGYGGPYPPPGPVHRYIFTLYALDILLNLPPGQDKQTVVSVMEGHILRQSELTGLFGR
jgi:hypothetical protein